MAEEIECITKKWGSSIGVIIPRETIRKEHITSNQKIRITIKKIPLAKELWGLFELRDKRPTQEIKDELKKGW